MLSGIHDAWQLRGVAGLSADALRDLQERKLREIIHYAYQRVPFYRERFKSAGIHPGDIRTVEDLTQVPITTKRDLQIAGVERTVARGIKPEACTVLRTSGNTGTPLHIYVGRRDLALRRLVELRTTRRVGFSARDRLASVGPHRARKPGNLTRLGLYRTTIISGLLSVEEQLDRLERFRPTILWILPTTLRAIYRTIGCRLRDFVQPHTVIFSGEVLDELLRAQIRDDLGFDPYNFYGSLELGRIAAECPAREGLHVNTDHVILETWTGDRVPTEGEAGTAVVTGLNGRAMPFLRYQIGDRLVRLDKRCSCGSNLPLIAPPVGRDHDILLLPSGRWVPPVWCSVVLRQYADILQFRIVQRNIDELRIDLVTRDTWSEEQLNRLRRELLERLGEPLTMEIECVDDIPDDKEKFRSFISRLPRELLDGYSRGGGT